MEYSEKKVTADINITNILEKYIRSGSVKSIQKLSQPNSYKIVIGSTATPSTFIEIRNHLRKHGFQTRTPSNHRVGRMYYQGSPVVRAYIPSERFIVAKVAAPPAPQNPDDFGRPRPRKSSQKKKRG